MKEELLEQANIAQKNIQDITRVLESIERIKIIDTRVKTNYQPKLRFLNMLKKKNGNEVQEAGVLLFDGVNIYGTELPVDERLLKCLREHYRERLVQAKAAFEAL